MQDQLKFLAVTTARLKSNVSRDSGNDKVFLRAWIVTLLKMMAVIVRKAFKTQFTTHHQYKISSSLLVGWYTINSSKYWFFISLSVFNPYGAFSILDIAH